MEWKVEWKIFINATGNGKWNGMEWNVGKKYLCFVEWKNNGM